LGGWQLFPSHDLDNDLDDDNVFDLKLFMMIVAMQQYPVHLYLTVALRISIERPLEGDSENGSGFGQVMALVLVVNTGVRLANRRHGLRTYAVADFAVRPVKLWHLGKDY
jgi:hypothetical protein